MARPAVFLDRDGTMIYESHFLARREDLRWFPWTVDAVRLLNRAGFLVFVTTNQGGIALGYYTEEFLRALHDDMDRHLTGGGARIDGWFYCPHHPNSVTDALRVDCECRKPKPGMIRSAATRFDIDLDRSFVIGDKPGDLGLAASVGARGVLVRTGYGQDLFDANAGDVAGAAYVAADLMAATAWILGESGYPLQHA